MVCCKLDSQETRQTVSQVWIISVSHLSCVEFLSWAWWKIEILCLEQESLAFWASVTITPHRLSDVTTIPTPTCLCSSLSQRSVQTRTIQPDCGMPLTLALLNLPLCHFYVNPKSLNIAIFNTALYWIYSEGIVLLKLHSPMKHQSF